MKRNQIIMAVIGIILIGGGAFYAGMSYAGGQAPMRGQSGQNSGFAGRGGGRGGGGFTAGKVISASNGSVTIQSQMSSSTEIVLLGASTQIFKTVSGSATDLTAGANVVVTGSANSDGSMTAQSIQIRPAGMNFGGRGGGAQTQ